MILIVTHKTDFTADFVVNKLNKLKVSYKRFNCEDILNQDLTFRLNHDFRYSILNENQYKAVWFRRTKLPELSGLSREESFYILNETESLLKNMFLTVSAKWLSHPASVYEAENKLLQLKMAQEIGFEIPDTLVTTSKSQLKEFYKDNDQKVIVKPIFQTRIPGRNTSAFIFTNEISQELIDEIENFDLTPCIFQRNIPKDYEIRVTIVGNLVFAASVYSQRDPETKTDWRKKKLKFQRVDLPKSIQHMCIDLVAKLNLSFGAIDLIKTPDDKYVFLEINPNGQWAWIENQTGQRISDAIINFLTHE